MKNQNQPVNFDALKLGDIVTLTNPKGTFEVVGISNFAVPDQVEYNKKIELYHTPESLLDNPLPAILQDKWLDVHASVTYLQRTKQWVYGALPLKPDQNFPDPRPAE